MISKRDMKFSKFISLVNIVNDLMFSKINEKCVARSRGRSRDEFKSK